MWAWGLMRGILLGDGRDEWMDVVHWENWRGPGNGGRQMIRHGPAATGNDERWKEGKEGMGMGWEGGAI